MKLKEIEIVGFKSFADKTRLVFDPGITAIVGPNGCGKSNISDAFRWVLGEQSAKSMRGNKMPDVIFAGTTHRKSLNFAEVTITFTDVNKTLPIDYEEVALTRRLHRSGESEYLINRHPVRLKDMQSLLLDSGIGKDTYSIFEQGKIDQVINLSPLERRYIFEEAAGILRFLQRKKEALRKLEQADQNVSRVRDIHKEVERQIIVLEEQAVKASQYRQRKQTLENLERSLLVAKWDGLRERHKELAQKSFSCDESAAAIAAQTDSLQQKLGESRQRVETIEKHLTSTREEVFTTRSTKEMSAKEKQNSEERLNEIAVKEQRWVQELKLIGEKKQQREKERTELQNAAKETNKQRQDQEEKVTDQRAKVKALDNQLSGLRSQQQTGQKELFRLVQLENQQESLSRQLNVRLENAQEKLTVLEERKRQLVAAEKDLGKQGQEKQELLNHAIQHTQEKKTAFAAMESRLEEIGHEWNKIHEEIDTLYRDMADAKARLKALQRLKEEMEGFSTGSKKLLQESSNEKSSFYGKIKALYEYVAPEKGTETAVALAMKPYAQTLVVETKEHFSELLAYLGKHKIKDVSLICLEILKRQGRVEEKKSKSLSPLAKHAGANTFTKQLLQNFYLSKEPIDPLEVIEANQGLDILTTDGLLIDRHSAVFIASQGENNLILRESEIRSLEKRIADSEEHKVKLEAVSNAIEKTRQQVIDERGVLDKQIRQEEVKLVEMNFAHQKILNDLEKTRIQHRQNIEELEGVQGAIAMLKSSLVATTESLAQAKKQVSQAQHMSEESIAHVEELAKSLKSQSDSLRELEAKLQIILDEQRKQLHGLHVLDIQDKEGEKQEGRLNDDIESGRQNRNVIELRRLEVDALIQSTEEALAKVVKSCEEIEQDAAKKKALVTTVDQQINDRRQQLKKIESDRNQLSIQSAQMESLIASLEKELSERHQLSISEARQSAGPLEGTPDQAEKQVKALRQQIAASGDINMTSIEECEKHKSRYLFLNQQIDDLDLSRKELVSIIAELDGESRKIFEETFEQVRNNFRKNFEVLFRGGEADLQMTDSSDVLEAGIEIIAKPPGKQMRSINLLSGGEKCLTAMALLFAIFEVKPAPFCILDEIDAPLDDANVDRFVNIVKQFVDRCQFIVITHNKRTMAIADVICGVSMEERGVSKLISMNFTKQGEPALAINGATA